MTTRRRRPGPAVHLFFRRRGAGLWIRRAFEIPRHELPRDHRYRGAVPLPFYYEIRNSERLLLFRGGGPDPIGTFGEYLAESESIHEAPDGSRSDISGKSEPMRG